MIMIWTGGSGGGGGDVIKKIKKGKQTTAEVGLPGRATHSDKCFGFAVELLSNH